MAGKHSAAHYLYKILTTPATASRFFASESTLWLAKLDRAKLESGPGELKWEASKSHGVFAHLYDADIEENAVTEVKELSRLDGQTWDDMLSDLEP
ncbi:hypothetical protein LTR78_004091 [Recurvomyces mirabilis]|uniref:Uncharacterized protein n=1 Tax=Recurvomyces mirabilis TaxID=574656 RepID=A0AAE1C2U9_9PEZI|nr:hypothetical protein LTR78_004091 [Recurvomyces mirabilis]KAK5153736.1 hypothetical protein LTS14_007430 [Recurvomyces mirabilis]